MHDVVHISEPGPVHQRSAPDTLWTRINAAEQIPGILTPLAFTFWLNCADVGVRGTFYELGVLTEGEVHEARPPDRRVGSAFYGRWAINVDEFRRLIDLMPGVDGATFENDVFGSSRPAPIAKSRITRLPIILVKAPATIIGLPRVVRRESADARMWWRRFTSESNSSRPAADQLREAIDVTTQATTLQMLAGMVGQEMFGKLAALAQRAGRPELHLSLCSGYGEMEETRMISALYDVAHRGGTVDQFLAIYGARCPAEVDLAAKSYRENPAAVSRLVEKYRLADNHTDPADRTELRSAQRQAAEKSVLAALPRWRRPGVRLLLWLAKIYIPLREEGKSILVTAVDGGRCAARRRGAELVAADVLDDVEDVFYLTLDEILGEPPADARLLVNRRRRMSARYSGVDVPTLWRGTPKAIAQQLISETRQLTISGVGASPGRASGLARVITEAQHCDDIEPDEILVCRTTDPSWASAFQLASAVVIDIGGLGSHGAIVCRELGLPCVINTGDGTRAIQTGEKIEVDGATGVVTIVERLDS